MKIVVVIPTYNEAGNVEKLGRALEEEFKLLAGHRMEILFVDANSPDDTAQIIRELQLEFKNIHLLVEREKRGLGAAYILGMKHAMENLAAEVVVEMDADFQHDPADLKRFVVQVEAGADYVIGSRFRSGGSIPRDWEFYRRILSVWGNHFSRLILSLPNVTDYTTGYKASRVHGFLDQIDLNNLASRGFAYKLSLLTEMVERGAKVREIPINFANREKGISKMEGNNPLESFKVVLLIRTRKSRRFLRFLAVGFVGLILDLSGYAFLVRFLRLNETLASDLSGQISIASNYYWNNRWTFAERKHRELKPFFLNLLFFFLASNVGLVVVRGGAIFFLSLFLDRRFYLLKYFLGTALLVIYNFTVYSRVIWRE